MKKIILKSAVCSAVITLILFAFQGIYAAKFGVLPLFSHPLYGGEVIYDIGIGWILCTFYPLTSIDDYSPVTSELSVYPSTLIKPFLILFIVFVVIFSLLRKKKEQ